MVCRVGRAAGRVVAHHLETADLKAPAWSLRQPLLEPWTPEHPFLTDRVRAQSPVWLSRQNIYVPARDLVTA